MFVEVRVYVICWLNPTGSGLSVSAIDRSAPASTSSAPMSYLPPWGAVSPKKSKVAAERKVGGETPRLISGEVLCNL